MIFWFFFRVDFGVVQKKTETRGHNKTWSWEKSVEKIIKLSLAKVNVTRWASLYLSKSYIGYDVTVPIDTLHSLV